MSIARKLAFLLALAITAMTATAAHAFATGGNTGGPRPNTTAATSTATVTPTGDYTGTEHGPSTLSNGVVTITCTTSNFTATIQQDGTFTVTALIFDSCEEHLVFSECDVTVDGLPMNAEINFVSGRSTWTQTTTVEEATILCGGDTPVHCGVWTTDTFSGTAANSTEATGDTESEFTVENGTLEIVFGNCGANLTWNSSWTLDSPGSYTITAA